MKTIKEHIDLGLKDLDRLNDELYLAVQKKDYDAMDRLGRELTLLANVIKDAAYMAKRGQE